MKLSSLEDKLDFRVATLTIENIYRKGLSFDKSFLEACSKAGVRGTPSAYSLAWRSLLSCYLAEKVMKDNKLENIPLRRKSAFIVAFRLIVVEKKKYSPFIFGGLIPGKFHRILSKLKNVEIDDIVDEDDKIKRLSILYSHPLWLVEKMVECLGEKDTERLLKSNEHYFTWLRVNTLKISVENAARKLEKEGVRVTLDKDYPILLKVLESKKTIENISLVKKGGAIPQDKASVAVVYALAPSKGETVIDACAAPGAKTSLIAQLMENRGRIIALDISSSRLAQMKSLLKKLGARNIDVIQADSAKVHFKVKADKALIDAPCSNSGAIRKDPALRITLRKINLNKFSQTQLSLLDNIAKYANEAVYATCSLVPEEGEEIVSKFKDHLVDLKYLKASSGYGKYNFSRYVRRFFPHLHQSIGFFIAKISL